MYEILAGMEDDTPRRPGRPSKELAEADFACLLDELAKPGTFAQACERAGTSAHVVKRAMAGNVLLDFEVRLVCMLRRTKKLCDKGADQDLLFELGREAALVDAGEPRREWAEVLASIRRRQDVRAALASARAKFELPAAQTAEDENF